MASTTYRNSTLYRNARLYRGTFTEEAAPAPAEGRGGGRDMRRYPVKERKRRSRKDERESVVEAAPVVVEPQPEPAPPPVVPAAPVAEFVAVVAKIVEAGLPQPPVERSVFESTPEEERAREQARAEVEALYTREREAEMQRLLAAEQVATVQRREAERIARLRRDDEELMLIIQQMELV